MKIALIRKEYTLKWGGAESYVVNLARLLSARGHEVHVFANSWDVPADPDITFHKVPMLSWYSPLKNLTFALNTKRLLAREQFDIVNGFSQVFPQDVYRAGDGLHRCNLEAHSSHLFSRIANRLNPRHRIILSIEQQIFKPDHFTHIIANSKLCKQQMLRYYGVREERVAVIYNGVDLSRFNPGVRNTYRAAMRTRLAADDAARVMLFVSRNFKRKGLRQLIESLALLTAEQERLQLVVLGRGNPRAYQRLASRLGVSGTIRFAGEQSAVEEYYAASDFLILPTLYDPFSNVCLEALACGLPVITTRSNGASELIRDGVNGFVLEDANRPEEMAAKISCLMREGICETMGEQAAATALHYTLEENLQQTLALYDKVIAIKKRFSFSNQNGIMVNREGADLLADNQLLTFDAVMSCGRGTAVKQVAGLRSTVKLALNDRNGETGVYLKRYHSRGIRCLVASLAGITPRGTAMEEWNSILAFHRCGIPTMIPLAAGARRTGPATCESFLITRELEGTERLDQYLAREMAPPLSSHLVVNKRLLLKHLALLVRRMHRSGFNHRDLYLCHVLVKKPAESDWILYIADLHRVDRRHRVGARWMIKDLAALNYSADPQFITRTDRLRFMRHYRDGEAPDIPLRLLVHKVLRKTERIRRHDRRLQEKISNHPHTGNALCEKIF
jgi:UDP-glucose:(heptosyl)LPS alpha-1,3-glucosyltransferase